MLSSSEGEGIVLNLGRYFQTIVKFASEYKNKVCPPIVFLDAIDSGMSIDNIADLSYVLNDICQKILDYTLLFQLIHMSLLVEIDVGMLKVPEK